MTPPDPKPDRSKENVAVTAIFVATITALILTLAFPPLRDWLIPAMGDTSRWPKGDRVSFVNGVEWVRLLFEVGLAMSISGLVFNDALKRWSLEFANRQEQLILKQAEDAIQKDVPDTLRKFKEVKNDILVIISGKPEFFSLRDLWYVMHKAYRVSNQGYNRGQRILSVTLWAWVLRRFAGGLHGLFAAVMFVGVLVTKALKQMADSPAWTG